VLSPTITHHKEYSEMTTKTEPTKAEKAAALAQAKAEKAQAIAEAKAAKEKEAAAKAEAKAAAAAVRQAEKEAKAKAMAEAAEKRAQAKAAKEAAAAAAKATREAERKARAEQREADGTAASMGSLVERAKAGLYVKGAQGQLRSNDDIALTLDVVPTDMVVGVCMEVLGEADNKYAHLNYGQQSMNYRNRLRGAIRKSVEVNGKPLSMNDLQRACNKYAAKAAA
jgi:chemotaxis protein histidine kinase CheA